ncbi:MAG: Fur family transcriptional regulator [Blastocatellales bacterium]
MSSEKSKKAAIEVKSVRGRKEAERQRLALRQMLDTRGANFTRQREAVFDYLRQVDHHPTAEEVFVAVKREMSKISLATVYKNLEALVACGAASKLAYGDSAARYEIRTDHHYHARCLKCGLITDVNPAAGEQALKLIKTPSGFKIADYRVELLGHCKNCK